MCTVDTECTEHQLMLLKRPPPQACQGESSGGLGAVGGERSSISLHTGFGWSGGRSGHQHIFQVPQIILVYSQGLADPGYIGREPWQGSQGESQRRQWKERTKTWKSGKFPEVSC